MSKAAARARRLTTFKAWLKEQTYREDPIGAFAREAGRNPCVLSNSYSSWRWHLRATPDAIPVFESAWQEWSETR